MTSITVTYADVAALQQQLDEIQRLRGFVGWKRLDMEGRWRRRKPRLPRERTTALEAVRNPQ